jgi:hypothetical protein
VVQIGFAGGHFEMLGFAGGHFEMLGFAGGGPAGGDVVTQLSQVA